MSRALPSLVQAKAQARAVRAQKAIECVTIGHAQALELVAQSYGFRDWNAFHAVIRHRPSEGWMPGAQVRGTYLSQPFQGAVLRSTMVRPGWFRIVLELDTPIDVVRFDSFSHFLRRVRGVVGPKGVSREQTSDGVPHLCLDIW